VARRAGTITDWRPIPARLEAPPGPRTPKSLHRVTPHALEAAMPAGRHFGSVRKLPSGRYQASYWHNVTRHVAPDTFPSKGDAQRWLSNIETAIHKGEWVDPAGGRMTVAELAEHWKSSDPSRRRSTKACNDAILRIHILPTLGLRRLRQVTPPDIQRLVNTWAEVNAPRTVDRQYDVVRAMFAYAVRSDWISRTPCRGIKLPAITATRRRALEADDIVRLAEAIDPRYQAVAKAGLAGAGFHDLRRANAITLVAEGVHVKTAQTRLSHAGPRTTLSIYARAVPKADRAAADALGRTFFQTPAQRSRTERARDAGTR